MEDMHADVLGLIYGYTYNGNITLICKKITVRIGSELQPGVIH